MTVKEVALICAKYLSLGEAVDYLNSLDAQNGESGLNSSESVENNESLLNGSVESGLNSANLVENNENLLQNSQNNENLSKKGAELVDDIVRCINLAAGDVAMYSYPLRAEKSVGVAGGQLFYSKIDQNLCELIALRKQNGEKVAITKYSDRVLAPDGVYTAVYYYLPRKLTLEDAMPFPSSVCAKSIVYSAACDFCLAYDRNNEAIKWNNAFNDEIERLERAKKPSNGKILRRNWL